jgi:hypothetical protein
MVNGRFNVIIIHAVKDDSWPGVATRDFVEQIAKR